MPLIAPVPSRLPLDVPVHRIAPELREWARITGVHAAAAAQGHWDDLLTALLAADRQRAVASGGKRLSELVSEGARGALTAALARADLPAALAEVARFEEMAALRPDDYAAAHLLAQAHLDVGWFRRGDALTGDPSREGWTAFLTHTARADQVLEPFDPLALYSPLLAATRYLLVRGLDDGEALCRDWFEDWCDLDPTNWTAHATHAPHLLPQWYGTVQGFDRAARAAMTRSEDRMGAAAYAMFYMAAADSLGDLPPTMDLGLYLRGLHDFRTETGCQRRANIVAGVLSELAHALSVEGPSARQRLAQVRAELRDVLTGALTEFHLPAWADGEASIRWALALTFGGDLHEGSRIVATGTGLAVTAD